LEGGSGIVGWVSQDNEAEFGRNYIEDIAFISVYLPETMKNSHFV